MEEKDSEPTWLMPELKLQLPMPSAAWKRNSVTCKMQHLSRNLQIIEMRLLLPDRRFKNSEPTWLMSELKLQVPTPRPAWQRNSVPLKMQHPSRSVQIIEMS